MYVEPSGCLLHNLHTSFNHIQHDNNHLDQLFYEAQLREMTVIGIDNQIQTAITATVQKMYPDSASFDKLSQDASKQAKSLKKKKITELAFEEMEEKQMILLKARKKLLMDRNKNQLNTTKGEQKQRDKEKKKNMMMNNKKKTTSNKNNNKGKKEKEQNHEKKRDKKHLQEEEEGLPKTIASRLGAYSQIISILRVHPCYLIHLYTQTFHNRENENVKRTASKRIKNCERKYFTLLTTIYGDLKNETHQHLFLLVTKQILIQEMSDMYDQCHGDLDTFETMIFNTATAAAAENDDNSSASVGTRCLRYYFCNAMELTSCIREHLTRPTTTLGLVQRSLTCDPIAIAKERGQNLSGAQNSSTKEVAKIKKNLYQRLDIKNEINDRKGEASEIIKSYVNSIRDMLRSLPYGISWLLLILHDYMDLMFHRTNNQKQKDTTNTNNNDANDDQNHQNNQHQDDGDVENEEDEEEKGKKITRRIRHLIGRIVVTSGILPAIRSWNDLHLISSDNKPSARYFPFNIRWLRNVLPNIIGNIYEKERDWNKMEIMQKERCSIQILNSVTQLLGTVDSNEMQSKLILNLYQERMQHDLIVTIDISTFNFLRWLMLVSGKGMLFESVEHHRLSKFNRNMQRLHRNDDDEEEEEEEEGKKATAASSASRKQATSNNKEKNKKKNKKKNQLSEQDDPVRIITTDASVRSSVKSTDSNVQNRIAENLWSSSGLLGSTMDFLAANNFERQEGNTDEHGAANLTLLTKFINNVGDERNAKCCPHCHGILPPDLITNDCNSIEMSGPSESILTILSINKLAVRDLLRAGRLPPDLKDHVSNDLDSSSASSTATAKAGLSSSTSSKSVVKKLETYWNNQLLIACKRNVYQDASLLSKAIEQLKYMRNDANIEIEKQRLGDLIFETLSDMIQRRKLYERLQSHYRSTKKLKRDIRLYLDSLISRQKYLEEYRHSLRYGQSEQQNRRVVAMEARSSLRKIKFLGLVTCCTYGKLTDPGKEKKKNNNSNNKKKKNSLVQTNSFRLTDFFFFVAPNVALPFVFFLLSFLHYSTLLAAICTGNLVSKQYTINYIDRINQFGE